MTMSSQLLADDNKSKEEPLPLNDPFVGDSSFSGGFKVISDGTSTEQKRIDLLQSLPRHKKDIDYFGYTFERKEKPGKQPLYAFNLMNKLKSKK